MRKRINRNAVCSSDNYAASHRAHLNMLQSNHSAVCQMVVSGQLKITINDAPKYKTIKVFGKEMVITMEEFNAHNTLK